jgi:hypothetical protein
MLKAAATLGAVRKQVAAANRAGMTYVKDPPDDPENDPSLSVSVVAVFGLEHQVFMGLVDEFDGRTNTAIVSAVDTTISSTMNTRDPMMSAIIALNPDGAGAGLADDMPDTLPIYTKEVSTTTAELRTSKLIPSALTALQSALTHANATNATVTAAWGGGE